MSKNLSLEKLITRNNFEKTLEQKDVSIATIAEGIHNFPHSRPKHSHKLAGFTFIVHGDYSVKSRNKTSLYSSNMIVWEPPNTSHSNKLESNQGKVLFVEIGPNCLETASQYAKIPTCFSEKNTSLTWLALRLCNEFRNWQNSSPLIAEGIILEMLGQSAKRNVDLEKHPPKWMKHIIEKLHEEFLENYSIERLAKEVDIHPVHLAAVFRKFHNRTIGEYVQKLRINYASSLLLNKDIPLCEVALLSGFSDQSHFTRVFKKNNGITPGAFRKSIN